MSNHETDVVAFFFGVVFLVTVAVAIAVRTARVGIDAGGSVAVAAALVLLVTGVVGILGSVRNRRVRRVVTETETQPPYT